MLSSMISLERTFRHIVANRTGYGITVKSDGPHGGGPYGRNVFENITIIDPIQGAIDINAYGQNVSTASGSQQPRNTGAGAADLVFKDVTGIGVRWGGQLLCAPDAPCTNITWDNVVLRNRDGKRVRPYVCENVEGSRSTGSAPVGCVSQDASQDDRERPRPPPPSSA